MFFKKPATPARPYSLADAIAGKVPFERTNQSTPPALASKLFSFFKKEKPTVSTWAAQSEAEEAFRRGVWAAIESSGLGANRAADLLQDICNLIETRRVNTAGPGY